MEKVIKCILIVIVMLIPLVLADFGYGDKSQYGYNSIKETGIQNKYYTSNYFNITNTTCINSSIVNNTINLLINETRSNKAKVSSDKKILLMHLNNDILDYSKRANPFDNGVISYNESIFGVGTNFSGKSQSYIYSTDTDAYNFNGDDFSISLWFKSKQSSWASPRVWGPRFIGKHEYGTTGAWALGLGQTGKEGKIEFRANNGGYIANAVSENTFNDGEWHHVVLTRDADILQHAIKIYVDGELENVSNQLAGNFNSVYRLTIGADQNGDECMFDGTLDEIIIYNETLSSGQVAELFYSSYEGIDHQGYLPLSGGSVNELNVTGETKLEDALKIFNNAGATVIVLNPNGQSYISSSNGFVINSTAEYLEAIIDNTRDPIGNAGFSFRVKGQEYKIGTNALTDFRILDNSTNNKVWRLEKGVCEDAFVLHNDDQISFGCYDLANADLHIHSDNTGLGQTDAIMLDGHTLTTGDGKCISSTVSTNSATAISICSRDTGPAYGKWEFYTRTGSTDNDINLGLAIEDDGTVNVTGDLIVKDNITSNNIVAQEYLHIKKTDCSGVCVHGEITFNDTNSCYCNSTNGWMIGQLYSIT